MSARDGDNVSSRSERTPWYSGPHLLDYLETVDVEDARAGKPFRMPVQWVNRPNADFRGFAGTIASGSVSAGDEVVVLPSGAHDQDQGDGRRGRRGSSAARAGDASPSRLPTKSTWRAATCSPRRATARMVADQFAAHLMWMSAENLLPGRSYLMKINHSTLPATVTEIKHRIDVNDALEACGQNAGAERGWRVQSVGCAAGHVRRLCGQPRHRRVHLDRSLFQRNGRRRDDRFCAAPRDQYPPSRASGEQIRPCEPHASPAGGVVVHRPARFGQVDHRESGRGCASCARRTHRHAWTATMCGTV